MLCDICNASEARFRCDWLVEKFTPVKADTIIQGDVLRDHAGNDMGAVVSLSRDGKLVYVTFSKRSKRQYYFYADQMVVAFREAPCQTPSCDNCARELSENRHYCARCWDKWKAIAA